MAVVIQNVGSNGRAALPGEDDFEDPAAGSTESSFTADNICFYFFTAAGQPFIMLNQGVNGTVSHTNMVKPTQIQTSNDDGVGQTIKGILVLGAPEKYLGNKPAKVFCVANPIVHKFEDFANITLNQIKQIAVTYDPDKNPFGKFVMTSSSYEKGEGTTNPEAEFDITGIDGKVKLDVELAGWELVKNAKKLCCQKHQ